MPINVLGPYLQFQSTTQGERFRAKPIAFLYCPKEIQGKNLPKHDFLFASSKSCAILHLWDVLFAYPQVVFFIPVC